MAKSVVAIVGRPNVGKSTFFNRCVGAKDAIVYDEPGVTRDRIYRECDWSGHDFLLVDTGGLVPDATEEIASQVADQVTLAINEADVIIFIVDGKNGLHGADEHVANMLRRTRKPVILAVNKIDEPHEETNLLEFYKLGLGDPMSLSALRGSGGVGDLLDKVIEQLPEEAKRLSKTKGKRKSKGTSEINGNEDGQLYLETEYTAEAGEQPEEDQSRDDAFAIAIVGRPNVGKSSIVNAVTNTKRTIVTPIPGTTRDAIDSVIGFGGKEVTLIDTAGIRRKSKVDFGVEAFSVVRSLRAIERADVAALMLDATQPVSDQDQKIGAKIEEAGKAAIIVVNKWDLIENKTSRLMNEFIQNVHTDLPHLKFAEVVFTSAITKQRLQRVLEASERAWKESKKRISTGLLNQVINEAQTITPPPSGARGRRLRVYYTTQVSVAPPTFVLFVNDAKLLTQTYKVYLERKIREAFGFAGTPIRLLMRAKSKD